jgi:hypothetical protein
LKPLWWSLIIPFSACTQTWLISVLSINNSLSGKEK